MKMCSLKTAVLVTSLLIVGLAGFLYSPAPVGFSDPWAADLVCSKFKLQKTLATIGEVFGVEYYKTMRAWIDFFGSERSDHDEYVKDTEFNGVPVRIYSPVTREEKSAGFVFYHGGGWVLCGIESFHLFMQNFAERLGIVVVFVEYRRAPEHVFPAAFDDSVTATKYFLKHASDFGVNPDRIGIGGDSAGGNLAAAISLKLRNDNFTPRNKLQVLIAPVTQAVDLQTPSYQLNRDDVKLSARDMAIFWSYYLQGHKRNTDAFVNNEHTSPAIKRKMASSYMNVSKLPPNFIPSDYVPPKTDYGDEKLFEELQDKMLNPYASPLLAEDLSNLPKAYVFTTEHDVLRDDGIWYGQRLEEAGVPVTYKHCPYMFHDPYFYYTSLSDAKEYLDELITYIKDNL